MEGGGDSAVLRGIELPGRSQHKAFPSLFERGTFKKGISKRWHLWDKSLGNLDGGRSKLSGGFRSLPGMRTAQREQRAEGKTGCGCSKITDTRARTPSPPRRVPRVTVTSKMLWKGRLEPLSPPQSPFKVEHEQRDATRTQEFQGAGLCGVAGHQLT